MIRVVRHIKKGGNKTGQAEFPTYITQDQPHYEVVLSVAIIAIARKVIILDLKEVESLSLIGIATIIIALTVGYFLMKKGRLQH